MKALLAMGGVITLLLVRAVVVTQREARRERKVRRVVRQRLARMIPIPDDDSASYGSRSWR